MIAVQPRQAVAPTDPKACNLDRAGEIFVLAGCQTEQVAGFVGDAGENVIPPTSFRALIVVG